MRLVTLRVARLLKCRSQRVEAVSVLKVTGQWTFETGVSFFRLPVLVFGFVASTRG